MSVPYQEAGHWSKRPRSPEGVAGRGIGKRKISTLVVDALPLRRECFARALTTHARDLEVTTVADPAESVDRPDAIDIVLLSDHGDKVGDPKTVRALDTVQSRFPGVPLIVLSAREETEAIVAAMQHRSVRGYIPMSLELGVVIEALRFVAAGGTFVPAAPLLESLRERQSARERAGLDKPRLGAHAASLYRIPPRQLEVLELLRQGRSNKIIAYELNMQESTVKVHVRHIMKKLGATNRTQAAFIAHQLFDDQDKKGSSGTIE